MSVVAKTWRKRVVVVLVVIIVLDFLMRMMFIGEQQSNDVANSNDFKISNAGGLVTMDYEQLDQLLAWADIKEEPKEEPVKAAPVQVVKAKPTPPPPPKVDVHKQVANAIKGDKSKYLIKDELLTLKGLFYDGQQFAVVEVENIITKKKQYFRSSENKALGKHKLEQIGKNFVVVSSGQQKVTLYMFGAVSS